MGFTSEILTDVLSQVDPGSDVIEAARLRRDAVLQIASAFPGALKTYWSGSIAHRTANFDTDADCGVVLDRRVWSDLGPDGEGVGPNDIVEAVRTFVRERIAAEYPELKTRLTKRAIKFTFHSPVGAEQLDPTADLIVALERAGTAPGRWIPNRETASWDPSHPEKHTELLTADPAALRRRRQKAIRLGKAQIKQAADPALCSFNIEALALEAVVEERGLGESLFDLFDYGATDLARRNTPDPAGVSPSIKPLVKRTIAARRMKNNAELVAEALENDDDEVVVTGALAKLFPSYVSPIAGSKEGYAAALRSGNSAFGLSGLAAAPGAARLKPTRAFGDDIPRP